MMLGLLSRRLFAATRAAARRARNSGWRKLERAHLLVYPTCAACGTRQNRQVHHIVPIHVNPALELDPSNLLTLCMSQLECHLRVGHRGTWTGANPKVRQHAAQLLEALMAPRCEVTP